MGSLESTNILRNRNLLSKKRSRDGAGPASIQVEAEFKLQSPWAPALDMNMKEYNSLTLPECPDEHKLKCPSEKGNGNSRADLGIGSFYQTKENEQEQDEEAVVDSTQSQ